LEALKKYEEVILLKRDTYGDRSETVSTSKSCCHLRPTEKDKTEIKITEELTLSTFDHS
jgi:hypothetical protein